MAHQYSGSSGPWEVDRPPKDEDEALLQQILWNNRLYLTDLAHRQICVLIGTRKSAQYFIRKEHNLDGAN